jgi:hypothetical protein
MIADRIELFLEYAALAGIGALLLAFAIVFYRRALVAAYAQFAGFWREIGVLGRVIAVTMVTWLSIYAVDKTNSPPQRLSRPFAPRLRQTQSDAEKFAANWNARGAWRDSFRFEFSDGWEFPWGTNHLAGAEIISQGALWPAWNDTNAVADVGMKLAIVPGLTSFSCEETASNSYRFAWTDAAIDRDTNILATAVVELFRNGDIAVTTNGVTTMTPRSLPFEHDGFGQCAEWVAANFTNAHEILAIGYPEWVDEQVGEGLTNGLYKLTVEVPDDPPEIVNVTVGDCSVAVTNAGEYVFLLKKGARYDLSASSDIAWDFIYSAVDDVPAAPMRGLRRLRSMRSDSDEGRWVVSSELLDLVAPVGFVFWAPDLTISPGAWHPSPANATRTFTATLSDMVESIVPAYWWSSGNNSACTVANGTEQSATFRCHFPAAYGEDISLYLAVDLMGGSVNAQYNYHIGNFGEIGGYIEEETEPGGIAGLALMSQPTYVFFEKGSIGSQFSGLGCFYQTDEPGTFELTFSGSECAVSLGGSAISSGYTWDAAANVSGVKYFTVTSETKSLSPSGTVFNVTFTPDEGTNTMESAANIVFVEWETKTRHYWPENRQRKELGVGENVLVRFSPVVNFVSVGCAVSSGCLVQIFDDYNYTAPTGGCLDVVSFRARTYDECQIPFEIFEPTSVVVIDVAGCVENIANVAGSFRMDFNLMLCPTNVSFKDNIEVAEMAAVSTNATGYFANPSLAGLLDHGNHGAQSWIEIKDRNYAGGDAVGPGRLYPPFSDGSFTWPIPNNWRMSGDNGNGKQFCREDQRFEITSNGTVRVWKFGRKGERALNSDTMTITSEAMP